MSNSKYDPMFEESKFGKPDHHFHEEEDTSDLPTVIDRNRPYHSNSSNLQNQTDHLSSGFEEGWFFTPF